jgi:hypothetical protein
LDRVVDLKRNFGGAPLSCPAAPSAAPVVGDVVFNRPTTTVAPPSGAVPPTSTPTSTPFDVSKLPTSGGGSSTSSLMAMMASSLALYAAAACSLFM